MVYKHGINDMKKGWAKESKWNYKIYRTWQSMLARCYSEKLHERYPTYIGCTVCERWLYLSNFIEDFPKIDGYNKELFLNGKLELDKDILSNGQNKEYSLSNCILVNHSENIRQAMKTRDYSNIQGENNPMYGKHHTEEAKRSISLAKSIKIKQIDKCGNLIEIWNGSMEIERKLGINHTNVIACCKWYECGEDLNEWHKIRKGNPNKTVGGYIWKYYIEE